MAAGQALFPCLAIFILTMFTWLIDIAFAIIKWPVALIAVIILPWAASGFWDAFSKLTQNGIGPNDFLMGAIVYFVAWFFIFRSRLVGSYLSTLEHELTHAIFAVLTLHRVKGLKITGYSGGHITYSGGMGNWLITISPYFVPTLAFLLLPIHVWVGPIPLFEFILGVTTSYHITSTYLETHEAQTDLQKTGKFFAWCFLPSANLLSYLFIFSWSDGGQEHALESVSAVFEAVVAYWNEI